MSKSKKGKHESDKAQYSAYKAENRALKNKQRKLEKHRRKHPNDKVASQAKASGHTRKASKGGSVPRKLEGYEIVAYEKVKNPKTGKMQERPVYKFMDNLPAHLPRWVRNIKTGNFFKLGNRVST